MKKYDMATIWRLGNYHLHIYNIIASKLFTYQSSLAILSVKWFSAKFAKINFHAAPSAAVRNNNS